MDVIKIVTSNQNKVNEYTQYLGGDSSRIRLLKVNFPTPEIQSFDHREILEYKIKSISREIKGSFIVDDVCFYTDRYKNFPGPYAKFINNTLGLLGWKKLFSEKDSIIAVATLGYYSNNEIKFFEGKIKGLISFKNKNKVDPYAPINNIFYIPKYRSFLGDLIDRDDFKNHRRKAFEKLVKTIIN